MTMNTGKSFAGNIRYGGKNMDLWPFPAASCLLRESLHWSATKRGYLPWSEYHAFIFLGLAAGLLGFVYTAGMLDAYEQLVENEKYTGRLLFKLRKKIRTKID